MSTNDNVLERSVLQAGKVFIRLGEEISRAYVIQSGEVSAFMMDGDRKIEVDRFGSGTIIGEMGLVLDEESKLGYEAITACTVVSITRQDFQKRLARADKSISTVLNQAIKKIMYYENIEAQKALKNSEIDDMALTLTQSLLTGLSVDKKMQYEDALLPHINGMIKAIKEMKNPKKTDKN